MLENRIGIIYIATNTITGKSYIGQTIQGLDKRRKQHEKAAKTAQYNPFHLAIKEYGTSAFMWSIIEDNIPYNKLSTKERHYIKEYDTYNNGYNSTIGGENATKLLKWKESHTAEIKIYAYKACWASVQIISKPVKDLTNNIVYKSINHASGHTGIDQSNISKCLNGKRKTAGGIVWVWA